MLSDYQRNRIANHFYRNSSQTPAATLYMALHTAQPNVDGTVDNEVSGGSYARQAVAFGAPTAGAMVASGDVTFSSLDVETIEWISICDASTGGHWLVAYDNSTIVTTSGESIVIPAAKILLTVPAS